MKYPPWPEGQKLVHLDLKGAPPKVEYLHKLIELFSDLGAEGLLVEYEDMFPYEGELQLLRATAQPAYSREEILSLLELARSKSMEVIPLVQTFGHMEFVLKHQPLRGLREMPHCVGTLNPHKKEGQELVMEMLRQVVESHPGVNYLHIGCDEVYILGEGEDSRQWLASTGCTVEQLFLSHVTKVAKAIKEAWPHITIIMWDDMMRTMSLDMLKDSGLVGLVQPMLWDYTSDLDVDRTVSLLKKYHTAGLSGLWAASSFKGSTCVHTCVPSTQKHVDNHLQWLKVAAALPTDVHLKGIALTGWQRYDHLSVLCELMPLALPSLGACLQTLVQGQLSDQAQSTVCERLSVPSVEVEALDRRPEDESLFPGRRLAELIVDLNHLLKSDDICFFENSMAVRGWLSPYQRQRRMVNPLITMTIHSQASAYLTTLQQNVEAVRKEMLRFYPECTAEEWIEEHVSPVMAPLQRITEDILACVKEIVP